MTICIVSPHLDDAVLSCGVKIQRSVAAGERVVIANIFSDGTNSEARQAEEINVAREIGADPFFLNELDAPDRDANFESSQQIFFGDLGDVPDTYIDHVKSRLTEFFKEYDVTTAIFPLGAGNHIDHRIAHAAGRRIKGTDILYYEDRPYILWLGILQGRMNTLKLQSDVESATTDDMTETLGHFYYHTKLPKGAFGEENLKLYLAALKKPEAYDGQAVKAFELTASDAEVEKTYTALAHYHSQMDFIYPDFETFKRDSLAHEHHRTGRADYIERYWKI